VVKRALAGLPGIKQAKVSLAEGKAWVAYDPSQVTVQRMVQAIDRVGFRARALESTKE
jgi:copper chaperone CopZ